MYQTNIPSKVVLPQILNLLDVILNHISNLLTAFT